jgi:putative NADH-flavin reductase
MNLLAFGATGSIGREVIKQALDQGHTVTAFVRDASKLEIEHPQLRVHQGDVLDAEAVGTAMQDQDAVLCALGAGRHGGVRAEGTKNIVEAMEKAGVERLVCQTTLGVGDSQGNLSFFWKRIMFGWFLKEAFADHVIQEEHVKGSALAWTIVRPGAFTDGERTGDYRHGFAPTDRTTAMKISRADVADFMLRQLGDDRYCRRTPGLSY